MWMLVHKSVSAKRRRQKSGRKIGWQHGTFVPNGSAVFFYFKNGDKVMKKILTVVLSLLIGCVGTVMFVGCDQRTVIGVLQYAEHGSLTNCYDGILSGLKERGYTEEKINIVYYNAKGVDADNTTYASTLINRAPAVAVGIATPSAYALASQSRGSVPVVFTAVSDPLAESADFSLFNNVTGTSDKLPVAGQLKLISDFYKEKEPDRTEAVKVGILYTKSEANSVSQIAEFEAQASAYNIEIIAQSVDTAEDIPSAASVLLGKVDCLNNLTDNNVVNNLATVLDKAKTAGKPVFGSEIEQVKLGCIASCSLDYFALGEVTGGMIADILDGTPVSGEFKFETIEDGYSVDYNSSVCEEFGFTLPAEYAGANDTAA